MMRYVSLDGVIISGERRFAFFDTVVDRFVDLDGEQTWNSVEDLAVDLNTMYAPRDLHERLVGLARGNGALEETPPDETCTDCGAEGPHACGGVPGGFGDEP